MSAVSTAIAARPSAKILVASPRAAFRKQVVQSLSALEGAAEEAPGGAEALLKLGEQSFHTLLLDAQLEDLDVNELMATIRSRHPAVKIVVLDREAADERSAFALGARAIETSSANGNRICGEEATSEADLDASSGAVSEGVHPARVPDAAVESLPGMIGTSRAMQQIFQLARLVARRDTAVLISGPTGTGKELVARGIHALSRRRENPFVVVNCAAIPESLLEAELFGYTRGAFTGAFQSRLGRIHAAHGGTLLLDEVGELPLSMQAKLLRFVQDGEVQRLGSADLFRVDTRLIAATNADLLQRVREKQFREDLYYRLSVFPLNLPALAERPEDIVPLAEYFLAAHCREDGLPRKALAADARRVLLGHAWPGNVRELQHVIERAFVLAEDREDIHSQDFLMPCNPD